MENLSFFWQPLQLLLHFIEYRLDQLNNKHMKIAVSLTTQCFESHSQKKITANSLKFFGQPTTKLRPCKNLRN